MTRNWGLPDPDDGDPRPFAMPAPRRSWVGRFIDMLCGHHPARNDDSLEYPIHMAAVFVEIMLALLIIGGVIVLVLLITGEI
jgi:hypothetical protein